MRFLSSKTLLLDICFPFPKSRRPDEGRQHQKVQSLSSLFKARKRVLVNEIAVCCPAPWWHRTLSTVNASPLKHAAFYLFRFFSFLGGSAIEGTHAVPMNIFHLIFFELLYLDPLPASLRHEYITKDTKENYFICGVKKKKCRSV